MKLIYGYQITDTDDSFSTARRMVALLAQRVEIITDSGPIIGVIVDSTAFVK